MTELRSDKHNPDGRPAGRTDAPTLDRRCDNYFELTESGLDKNLITLNYFKNITASMCRICSAI